MSETAVKKEKKKWSTGKKVAVILCSVLLALILIVVSGGLIFCTKYHTGTSWDSLRIFCTITAR